MKFINFKGVFIALALLLTSAFSKDIVLVNQKILSDKVAERIELIGDELFEKSSIYVGIGVFDNLDGKNLKETFNELNLKPPFAFLMLSKFEHKVEIFADSETLKLFNKEGILSPYPSSGSILPILTSKNGKDIYNAAMLNGYADLAEQIASSKRIKLENALGSSNKIFLEIIRFFVYGSIIFVIVVMSVKKFRNKNAR